MAELEAIVAGLAGTVDRLKKELARKDDALIYQKGRIDELERAVGTRIRTSLTCGFASVG